MITAGATPTPKTIDQRRVALTSPQVKTLQTDNAGTLPWYPDVEPGDLRRAAQAYHDLGTAIDDASRTAGPGMQQFFAANQTDTLTPYREAWTALADPSAR